MAVEFGQVTFDCADAAAQAMFWSQLMGTSVDEGANEFFATAGRGLGAPVVLMFIKVPESKTVKNRVHVDLLSHDREAEVRRAVSLGATHVADFDEYGMKWSTLLDPEGNEFDIGSS